jgi:hypothetical protein
LNRMALAVAVSLTLGVGNASAEQTTPAKGPFSTLDIYTSPVEHTVPRASCHPKCSANPPPFGQGDDYQWNEPLPYPLDKAWVFCRQEKCRHNPVQVTVDSTGKMAHIWMRSRSKELKIRLQGAVAAENSLKSGMPDWVKR